MRRVSDTRLERSLFWLSGVALVSLAASLSSGFLLATATPVWVLAGWRGRRGESMLGRGITVGMACLVFALVLLGVSADPSNFIEFFTMGLGGLVLIKLFDQREVRDRGMLFCMCTSLVVGSALLHSSLIIGVLLAVYLVLSFRTAALLQLAIVEERASGSGGEMEWGTLRRGVWPGALVCLGVMVVVFVLMPRGFMTAPSVLAGRDAISVSGFDPEIELNSGGDIAESFDPVLEVRSLDDDVRFTQLDKLYLRGAVLEVYAGGRQISSEKRLWRPLPIQNGAAVLSEPPAGSDLTLLELRLIGREEPKRLFTIGRTHRLTVGDVRGVLLRTNRETREILREHGEIDRYVIESELQPLAGDEGEVLEPAVYTPRIKAFAQELLDGLDLNRDSGARHTGDDERIVRFFERYLRTNYRYTTSLVKPAPGEDPIEAFLFGHQQGHCELFATALTALVRSAGIEARSLTGYLTTERTEYGAFVVRNAHAHAWVEAHVSPGLWMRFDASPPGDVAEAHQAPSGPLVAAQRAWRWVSDLWVRSVVSYDNVSQSELLGDRFTGLIDNATQKRFSLGAIGGWRGLLRAGALGGAVFAGVLMVGQLWPLFRRGFHGIGGVGRPRGGDDLSGVLVRADRALDRAGLGRLVCVPLRTHARVVGLERPEIGAMYDELAGLHYAARFGGADLSEATRLRAAELLVALRGALREGAR